MTTTKDFEYERAHDLGRPNRIGRPRETFARAIIRRINTELAPVPVSWPSSRWAEDPVGFAHDVLGVQLWEKQRLILEAIRDHSRCAVCGGRKVGKDHICGVAALWWFCSFPDARVIMTATRAKQVDDVLWRDIKKLHREHGFCFDCKQRFPKTWREMPRPCPHSAIIPEVPGVLARTGLKSTDLREITGYTAAEAEGMAGVSGTRMLYLIDEASAFPEDLHVAIRGNMASEGCKEVMISNPTRTSGKFFDAFHGSKRFYWTIQISSEESPNVVEGREVVPGLASRSWITEQREEWGKDSALYKIHVLGQFVLNEDGKIIPAGAITGAIEMWDETPSEGALRIGVDPAGPGLEGDESGFAARRGMKVVEVYGKNGLSEEGHIVEALGLIRKHGRSGELADIIIDSDGLEGAKVYGAFLAYCHAKPVDAQPFRLIRVRGAEKARRKPDSYHSVRDELWGSLAEWLRHGGALPADSKLQRDLNAPSWESRIDGKVKVTPKKALRAILGRSPDRGDAVTLACWDPIDYEQRAEAQIRTRDEVERERRDVGGYAGDDPWKAVESMDPWAALTPRR